MSEDKRIHTTASSAESCLQCPGSLGTRMHCAIRKPVGYLRLPDTVVLVGHPVHGRQLRRPGSDREDAVGQKNKEQ